MTSQSPAVHINDSGRTKVPIPRMERPKGDEHAGAAGGGGGRIEKTRVSHACQQCRQRKTKCNGERPVCGHCEEFGKKCYYGDGKRELAKKNARALENRVKTYEQLLLQLQPLLDSAGQLAVQKVLDGEFTIDPTSSSSKSSRRESLSDTFSLHSPPPKGGESLASGDAGSTHSLDHVTKDVNTAAVNNPTGFLGKASEVSWLQRAKELAKGSDPTMWSSASNLPTDLSVIVGGEIESSIYLDDLDISLAGSPVDPFAIPSKDIADALVTSYFNTVHPFFPIIYKPFFMAQYQLFFESLLPLEELRRWLSMLNLVFAIGETYANLANAGWRGSERDHISYLIRARILGALDGGVVFEIPDMQQVQVLGLTGMYLLASNQLNRSWSVVGLAIRLGHGLGLHLRNDAPTLSEMQKEMRVRTWYSIHYLETILCLITGRPSTIQDKECSAPVPRPLGNETNVPVCSRKDHMPDIYFLAHTELAYISAKVLRLLYSAQTVKHKSWADIQMSINELVMDLSNWKSELPSILDFSKETIEHDFASQRLDLEFQFHHIQLLIHRPCFCLMEGRIPNESAESKDFNRNSAVSCIQSARKIISLIISEPAPTRMINTAPWWCFLHYLVSAEAVVLLEMIYCGTHVEGEEGQLFRETKEVIQWLGATSESTRNLSIRRCYLVLKDILKDAAPKIGEEFEDSDDPGSLMEHVRNFQTYSAHSPDKQH